VPPSPFSRPLPSDGATSVRWLMVVVALIAGLVVGAAAVWVVARARESAHRRAQAELEATFTALSSQALRANNEEFLQLATTKLEGFHRAAEGDLEQRRKAVEQLVAPLKESLVKVDLQVQSLEASRRQAYGALSKQVELLAASQERLRTETASLVKALRSPSARGRWGEMQLRRALEMAGMLAHCDFVEQPTVSAEEGLLRPDVIVKLAGGKHIVVDAKVPLEALLDAFQADDEAARDARLQDFVRHVRDHMAKLSLKAYWRQFTPSPEFVVMFLPSESFYRYAVEQDSSLLELGPSQKVILASPTNLIALLLGVARGWQEETLAESARQVSELGRELYDRLATMGGHVAKLGKRLEGAVEAYNETVGSLESRVLPSARRFPELGVPAGDEIAPVSPVERMVKPLTAPELVSMSELRELPGLDADAA
jgi:DNA recombination protein RmuC